MSSSPASVLVVISEVDSMEGVVEGGTVLSNNTSLAIEKVQAELRQEYDVREARKLELEFLEKGGDPLDFKFGNAASVNIQSASFTNQHPDWLLTRIRSEANSSFGFTVSPRGDSIESSGRRGAPTREASSADNLLLFDAEHAFSEGGQNSSQVAGSEKVRDGSQKTRDGNSASLSVPKKSYRRRNRSRPNRDGTRLSSSDVNPTTRSSNGPRDIKRSVTDTEKNNASSNWKSKPHSLVDNALRNYKLADGQHAIELDVRVLESTGNPLKQVNQQTISVAAETPIEKDFTGTNDLSAAKADNRSSSRQMNCFSSKGVTNDVHVEVKDSEIYTNVGNIDSNVNSKDQTLVPYKRTSVDAGEFIEEKKVNEAIDSIQLENGFIAQPDAALNRSVLPLYKQVNDHSTGEVIKYREPDAGVSVTVSNVSVKIETPPEMKSISEINEDSILNQAEIIKANRKKITELSVMTSPMYVRQKSGWDYVLEEMAWLANDFAQERIWKLTAAAQISRGVAFTSRWKKQGKCSRMDVKNVAHVLTKVVMEFWRLAEERSREVKEQHQQTGMLSVQSYAVRFLKYNSHADKHVTPDQISDSGVLDLLWDDKLTEENLFYTISHGAMETYRKSIESHVAQWERIGTGAQEEVETSAYDDFESKDATYDGDEGEINMHMSSSRYGQKKRKHLANAFTSSLNVSIPTKRMRTATRRVISPINAVISGQLNKTDVSTGDTSSFPDDQTTMHYGSFIPNHLEVDSAEVSTKPKKKKAKNLNVAYEQKWQGNSVFQHEQRVNVKKRSESHQFETNSSRGLPGQPVIKKPKIIRQVQDNSFDNLTSIGGSVPSPVASQLSNMSNPNKFTKTNGGRGRKCKVLKVPNGLLGSGTSWSPFEEQALVVLVHDLGPNWELISDAINSVLHFKCMFRNAIECKERHNILMDRTSGDGADSAEDSGSSQPYPSTLPGIPKGSARQLFQRLQGPMEEDTLKSHFEKIIMIGQEQHHRKMQDPKNIQQPHSSHSVALSQVCPNNLNGGPVLMPPELCDVTFSSTDMPPVGYQGSHLSGLPISSQSGGTPIIPSSGPMPAMQGSPNLILGNTVSSSPSRPSSSIRNGRYGVPRSVDEQQRMQQQHNNLVVSGRSVPQSSISSAGGDRGVRVGGNGLVSRSMPMARPGLQGIVASTSSMVNSGSMVSPGLVVGSGQGSPMLRPHEASHIMRPDLQMPTGNSPGTPSHFGGLSPAFPNQTASPVSYQSHAMPPQRHHPQVLAPQFQGPINQQQAHAYRLAKERQLRHKFQQQQQKQLASSIPLVPPVQPQPQLPLSSSPIQNNSLSSSTNSMPQPKPSISGLANQTSKQWQRQFSQANRQHPQQRQLSHAQPPQLTVAKGVGRGNMIINNQCLEKGEPTEHLIESQGLYGGSARQLSRQHVPQQQKPFSSTPSAQPQNPTLQSDNIKTNHGNVPQQKPLHQKLVSQNSMLTNMSEPQAGQGPNPCSSPVRLAHVSDVQRQQTSLQAPQTLPAPSHQQQMPTLSAYQQQAQLLQSGNGDSYSRSSDSRLE